MGAGEHQHRIAPFLYFEFGCEACCEQHVTVDRMQFDVQLSLPLCVLLRKLMASVGECCEVRTCSAVLSFDFLFIASCVLCIDNM